MERPTVDGLRNLGNTCYLNTVLQALASCTSLLSHLEESLQQLDAASSGCCAGPVPASASVAAEAPLAAALLGVLRQLQPHGGTSQTVTPRQLVDAFRGKLPAGVLEAGEEHDASEAVEELCRIVAEELQFSFSRHLQPQLAARATVTALLQQPSVMALARSQGSSDDGCSSSKEAAGSGEGAAACNGHAVLRGCRAEAAGGSQTADAQLSMAGEATATAAAEEQPSEGATAAAAAATAAAAGEAPGETAHGTVAQVEPCPPDAVLQGWQRHAQLPLHGSTADELHCLRCRHRSMVQLSPFWVLSLPIPTARGTTLLGNVPAAPGASLEACLASAFAFEALQGWHCTRCSLATSLVAAQLGAAATSAAASCEGPPAAVAAAAADKPASSLAGQEAGSSGEWQPELGQKAAAASAGLPTELQRLQQGLAAGGRLAESEANSNLLARAGLAWVPRPSPAAKRSVAARLPRVLCLQLRRGFWSEHGHVKVAGHVSFPLLLALPPELVPRLGHGSAPQSATPLDFGALLQLQQQRRPVPRYMLRAVVVHHGPLAGAGHYTVFRSLGAAADCGSGGSDACGVGGGGGGGGSGSANASSSSSGAVHRSWVRASDEAVHPAELREVLEAEASMLVYEACG